VLLDKIKKEARLWIIGSAKRLGEMIGAKLLLSFFFKYTPSVS
jgi:hypothetical protein